MAKVHVADGLYYGCGGNGDPSRPAIDSDYLQKLNLVDRLSQWQDIAAKPERSRTYRPEGVAARRY